MNIVVVFVGVCDVIVIVVMNVMIGFVGVCVVCGVDVCVGVVCIGIGVDIVCD